MHPGIVLLALGGGLALLLTSKKSGGERDDGPLPEAPKGSTSLPGGLPHPEAGSGVVKAALAPYLWEDVPEKRVGSDGIVRFGESDGSEGEGLSTPRSLSEGTTFASVYGATDPLRNQLDRVTFELLRSGDRVGALEGVYVGSGDTDKPGEVVVDRIAHRLADYPLGTYSVPAGKNAHYSTVLQRVRWDDVDPKDVDLYGFEKAPLIEVGDKATLVVRDLYGTTAVVIVLVRKVGSDGSLTVSIFSPYRVLKDVGAGAPVLSGGKIPFSQAIIETKVAWLVNPKSLV